MRLPPDLAFRTKGQLAIAPATRSAPASAVSVLSGPARQQGQVLAEPPPLRPVRTSSGIRSIAKPLTRRPHMPLTVLGDAETSQDRPRSPMFCTRSRGWISRAGMLSLRVSTLFRAPW